MPCRRAALALLPLIAVRAAGAAPAAPPTSPACPAPPALSACAPPGPRAFSINVTEAPYEADPTGRKDCSDAVQAAIAALASRCGPTGPGGEIVFPPGRYHVAKTIVLPQVALGSPIHVRGAGATLVHAIPPDAASQAVLLRPGYPDKPPALAQRWTITGLAFEGRNCPGSKGLEIHGVHQLVVRGCSFAYLEIGMEARFCLASLVESCTFTLCASHGLVLADETWTGRDPRLFYGCNASVVRQVLSHPCGTVGGDPHCRGTAARSAVYIKDSASVVVEECVFNGPRPFHAIEHRVTAGPPPDNNVKDLEIRRTWFEFYVSPPKPGSIVFPDGDGLPKGEPLLPSLIRTNAPGLVVVDGAFVQDVNPSCAPGAAAGSCVDVLFLDGRSELPYGRFLMSNVVGVTRAMKFGAQAGQWLAFDNFDGLRDPVPCSAGGRCYRENVRDRIVGRSAPEVAIDELARIVRSEVELSQVTNAANDAPFLQLGRAGDASVAHFGADEVVFHVTPKDASDLATAPVLGRVGAQGWRFQRNVDLAGNDLVGAAIEPRSDAPPDAKPGRLWFNVRRNRFEYYGTDRRVHALGAGE